MLLLLKERKASTKRLAGDDGRREKRRERQAGEDVFNLSAFIPTPDSVSVRFDGALFA